MNPYKYGDLGVIKKGAYADLILVDGNPLERLEVLNEYKTKFNLIMKNGVVHKNTL
jgi:imidazolonepropionase-like amidohydrolase